MCQCFYRLSSLKPDTESGHLCRRQENPGGLNFFLRSLLSFCSRHKSLQLRSRKIRATMKLGCCRRVSCVTLLVCVCCRLTNTSSRSWGRRHQFLMKPQQSLTRFTSEQDGVQHHIQKCVIKRGLNDNTRVRVGCKSFTGSTGHLTEHQMGP